MAQFTTDTSLSYSQRKAILRYMEENGSITSFEAMSKLHIMSPRKRLSEINRMTPLEKKYEYSISHDPSGRKHVVKYVRYSIAK